MRIHRGMAQCTHHWDLGTPRSGIVHGKCRKCGAEKDYPSNVDFKFSITRRRNRVTESQTANGNGASV
jgi:hypothetical protein